MTPWKFLLGFLGVCTVIVAAAAVWAEGGSDECPASYGYWDGLGDGPAVCRPHGEVSPHLPKDYGTAQPTAETAVPTAVPAQRLPDTGWQYARCPEGETVLSVAYNTGESQVSYYCGRP